MYVDKEDVTECLLRGFTSSPDC